MGIVYRQIHIKGWFNHWWQQKSNNIIHKQILQITPIIVCWEIWKSRCSCKYGEQKRFNFYNMKKQITWNIHMAILRSFPGCNLTLPWNKFCEKMMRLQPIPETIIVAWTKPLQGSFKLNTDGSYLHGNGKAGLGGIMRNDQGELVMAFSISAKCNSNNDAEAQAALFGIRWSLQHGFSNFIIELDSLLVVNMLKEGRTDNYKMKKIIDEDLKFCSIVSRLLTSPVGTTIRLVDLPQKFGFFQPVGKILSVFFDYQKLQQKCLPPPPDLPHQIWPSSARQLTQQYMLDKIRGVIGSWIMTLFFSPNEQMHHYYVKQKDSGCCYCSVLSRKARKALDESSSDCAKVVMLFPIKYNGCAGKLNHDEMNTWIDFISCFYSPVIKPDKSLIYKAQGIYGDKSTPIP